MGCGVKPRRVLEDHAYILVFGALWVLSAYLFYKRYPFNYDLPNFFAEDGTVFEQNLDHSGFFRAVFTPFNGYFTVGLYILLECAHCLNAVFYSGYYVDVPKSISVISFTFLGFCAAYSYIVFRKLIGSVSACFLAITIAAVPLPNADLATIGTLGNLKFAFAYLCVLCLIARSSMSEKNVLNLLCDLVICICLLTTASCYLFLPFLLTCGGLQPKEIYSKFRARCLSFSVSMFGIILISVAAISQIFYVYIHGIPTMVGYLDGPFVWKNAIEMFVGRSFLFGFMPEFYEKLSDSVSIIVLIVLLLLGVIFIRPKLRNTALFLVLSCFIITFLLARVRTGLSADFTSYQQSGNDQFFYGQNYLAVAFIFLLVAETANRFKILSLCRASEGLTALIAIGVACTDVTHVPNVDYHLAIGPLVDVLKPTCRSSGSLANFPIYPVAGPFFNAKSEVCSQTLEERRNIIQAIAPLASLEHGFDVGSPAHDFMQNFTATEDHLAGLFLFVGTYGNSFYHGYDLVIKDQMCSHEVRRVEMPLVMTDGWAYVNFPVIKESKNKSYCFSVYRNTNANHQLALYLSKPDPKTGYILIMGDKQIEQAILSYAYYR